MSMKQHIRLSMTARLFILFFVVVLGANSLHRHYNGVKPFQFVMSSDMEGYYQYLPYVFFKEYDITQMRWAKNYRDEDRGIDARLNVFTCGVAILELPFFLAAHLVSEFLEMEERGYNNVYFLSVMFSAIFYGFLGLYLLFKSLKRIFSRKTAFRTVLLIFLATNLFYYTVMKPGMSHVYSFFLLSLYIWLVPGFYEKPGVKSALKLILPLALAVLIRPTTIVAGFYFLLYGITSLREFWQRLAFLAGKWYLLLLMGITAILFFLPQMLYWHEVTDKWFVYSYQREGFDNALTPRFRTVLIGARNGWYLYTPLMLVATAGLFYLAWMKKYSGAAIFLVMLLIVYINSSWWLPTFSSAAGYRTLVEWIPFMAIPLAWIIESTWKMKGWKITLHSLFSLFIVYNILFSFRYSNYHWWHLEEWQWSNFLRLIIWN